MALDADTRHNYELECQLADQLRAAPADQRRSMYATIYDEFFRKARHRSSRIDDPREIARQVRIVTHFLPPNGRYLEVGAGTCRVASQVALSAREAYALEVSTEVVQPSAGVQVVISDGVTIPIESETVDLVYSNQLMEHLHPDDATEQVQNIRRALACGGRYVCITPNRLTGPHDISKYFGDVPRGFHLREYTIGELRLLFLDAGFRDVRVAVSLGGEVLIMIPGKLYAIAEILLGRLPRKLRRYGAARKFFDPGPVVALK